MAYLDRFDHDIFLSHGWAGNQDETSGDRKWVSDLRARLSRSLSDMLLADVSIFLDVESPRNGETKLLFQQYIRKSAILLAVVTPSFCRPGSFCREELRWFSDQGRPIHAGNLTIAERIFKVVSRPVLSAHEPPELRNHSPYTFYEGQDPGPNLLNYTLPDIASLHHLFDTRIQREFPRLVQALANFLSDCKRNQADAPIRTIFLAESTSTRRRSLEALLTGSDLLSSVPSLDMSEEQFIENTNAALAQCDRSIHLIDPASSLSSEPCRPAGWKRSILEIQLLCAHTSEHRKAGYRQIVWCDLRDPIADPDLKKLVEEVRDGYTTSGFVDFLQQGFEYLTSNLSGILARTQANEAGQVVLQHRVSTLAGKSIYVQCLKKDLGILEPAFRKIYGELWVQFPIFGGKKDDIQRLHEHHLKESDATFIYFGNGPGTWAYLRCDEAMRIYGQEAHQKKRIVGLDPPSDPLRQSFRHRDFMTIPFPARSKTVDPADFF